MLCKIDWISFSAVSVVSANSCVGPSPRIKIFFFFFPTCTDELVSPPKNVTFLRGILCPISIILAP